MNTKKSTQNVHVSAVSKCIIFKKKFKFWVWLCGRVVRTLDLQSVGCEFESRPLLC